jgi:hypothetical protein
MYSAHFDASGTAEDNAVLTIAGCVSTVDRWVKFEPAWNKILTDDGLPKGTIFHMTDFVTCNRPFHIYRNKSEKKARLISNLVSCVAKHVCIAFSVDVVIEHYNGFDEHWCLHETYGSPYSFAGLMAVQQTKVWLAKKKRKQHVKFFFEKGDDCQDEFERFCLKLHGFKPLFIPKEEMVQFQPGDLIAWKHRTASTNAIIHGESGDIVKLDSILRSLDPIRPLHGFSGVYDEAGIRRVCHKAGIKPRT